LTTEKLPDYLSSHAAEIGQFSVGAALIVEPIVGGNINFAWKVSGPTGKTVFVKQAPGFVAFLGPGKMPLTSDRMLQEIAVYAEWKAILGQSATMYLPDIYFFDAVNKVFVMEFLGDEFRLMDNDVIANGHVEPDVATGLGEFIGRIHAATHSSVIPAARAEALANSFENRAMRNIQLEFVFTKAFVDPPSPLRMDDAFKAEIEKLKSAYDGKCVTSRALCHGDLHPG